VTLREVSPAIRREDGGPRGVLGQTGGGLIWFPKEPPQTLGVVAPLRVTNCSSRQQPGSYEPQFGKFGALKLHLWLASSYVTKVFNSNHAGGVE
jgi:hypothetical protein